MSYASKFGSAHANPRNPRAFAICDRCGFGLNHYKLRFQFDWAGASMRNKMILVCPRCTDKPQQQLRAIVLPADPLPILNPRPPDFAAAETDVRITGFASATYGNTGIPVAPPGDYRITQSNRYRTPQQTGEAPGGLNVTPGVPPDLPEGQDPGLPYGNDEVPRTE
jgi:hypothetical protein